MRKQEDALQRALRLKDGLQKGNTFLRAENKALQTQADISNVIRQASEMVAKTWRGKKCAKKKTVSRRTSKCKTELEILLGDVHFGKKHDGYSSEVAKQCVAEYAQFALDAKRNVKPDRTTLVVLGDMIENSSKHPESREGCDTPTAVQISDATKALLDFIAVVEPDRIVAISGNHENPAGKGTAFNVAGRVHFSHIIYSVARHIYPAIDWIIPEGAFATYKLPGGWAVAEHGSEIQPTENGITQMLLKRAKQANVPLRFLRMGDKHQLTVFNGGEQIINGAMFSDRLGAEFSGVKGYCSNPGQFCVIHKADGISGLLCYNTNK